MGTPTLWDRLRYWVRPLVAIDAGGRDICCWFWQRKRIAEYDRRPQRGGFSDG